MSKISPKTKKKQGRGKGHGKDYKPHIKAREFNSKGTCSNIVDWKTGRQMELLSQIELSVFMQLRWDDTVDEIQEQYPLNLDEMNFLIQVLNDKLEKSGKKKLSIKYDEWHPPTSDMVVYREGKISEVISIKYDKTALSQNEIESLWVEKHYWGRRGCKFRLLDRSDINEILIKNLRLVTEYYDISRVHDSISLLKHKIATKEIIVDMTSSLLDFRELMPLLMEKQYE